MYCLVNFTMRLTHKFCRVGAQTLQTPYKSYSNPEQNDTVS